jgi:hypothetical protein
MPKPFNLFWQYGEPKYGTNRQRLSCKIFGQPMTRRVSQLKYHLAKLTGHDVGICTASTPEIMQVAPIAIYEKDKKRKRQLLPKLNLSGGVARSSRTTGIFRTRGNERDYTDSPSMRTSPFFVRITIDEAQPSIQSMVKKRRSKKQTRLSRGAFYGATYL